MTLDEQQHLYETEFLSPYAAKVSKTKGRAVSEAPCPLRNAYCRDRDRIVHCKAFRRLKTKTQVFLAPQGDHYRTRLTHTLEVSQIARTITRAMRLNEDLTEAISLGHDLGHTPFGHAGERALNQLNPNGFTHFEQSVRVITVLEKYPQGLNATYEVIDGIRNHTRDTQPQTIEGRIVRLSDRIAYINHDIEDSIAAGILSEDDLPREITDILGTSKSQRITTLLSDLVSNGPLKLGYSPDIEQAFTALHEFMFANVYLNSTAKTEEQKVLGFLGGLYEHYKLHPDQLPEIYLDIMQKDGIDTAVTDYISGMSDVYATAEFERIYIPRRWTVIKQAEGNK